MSAFTPKKYKVLSDRVIGTTTHAVVGDIVYSAKGYDYGVSSDDTRHTGIPHVSVSKEEDGDYPFFTIPSRDLELVG